MDQLVLNILVLITWSHHKHVSNCFFICAGFLFHPSIFGAALSYKREKQNTYV